MAKGNPLSKLLAKKRAENSAGKQDVGGSQAPVSEPVSVSGNITLPSDLSKTRGKRPAIGEVAARHVRPRSSSQEPVQATTGDQSPRVCSVPPPPPGERWRINFMMGDMSPVLKTNTIRNEKVALTVGKAVCIPADMNRHRKLSNSKLIGSAIQSQIDSLQKMFLADDRFWKLEQDLQSARGMFDSATTRINELVSVETSLKNKVLNAEFEKGLAQKELEKEKEISKQLGADLKDQKAEVENLLKNLKELREQHAKELEVAEQKGYDECADELAQQVIDNEMDTYKSGWIASLVTVGIDPSTVPFPQYVAGLSGHGRPLGKATKANALSLTQG